VSRLGLLFEVFSNRFGSGPTSTINRKDIIFKGRKHGVDWTVAKGSQFSASEGEQNRVAVRSSLRTNSVAAQLVL
jgi:hypothetical protein